MITEISVLNGDKVVKSYCGEFCDTNLQEIWQDAKHGESVQWFRASDGQLAYWGDEGASIHPIVKL